MLRPEPYVIGTPARLSIKPNSWSIMSFMSWIIKYEEDFGLYIESDINEALYFGKSTDC